MRALGAIGTFTLINSKDMNIYVTTTDIARLKCFLLSFR